MIESYISSKFIFLLGDVDKFGFFNKQLLTYEYWIFFRTPFLNCYIAKIIVIVPRQQKPPTIDRRINKSFHRTTETPN